MSGDESTLSSSLLPPRSSLFLSAGAIAGLSVDLVLFPMDTIKTRMQSRGGLTNAGGFRKLFSGIASAAAGSAPTAALFFFTYETSKHFLTPIFHATPSPSSSSSSTAGGVNPLVHCFSACLGETVACLIRVPTENVKQKVQAGMYRSSWECFRALIAASPAAASSSASSSSIGVASNFYRGFGSTILREIPFALIQFPLYEWSKWRVDEWRRARDGPDARPIDGWQCALVGSLSGGVAAAATTPLDVVKTRLILERVGTGRASLGVVGTFRSVYSEGGVRALFAGVVPRVLWISLGGGVFFGAYEASKRKLETIL